MFSFLTSLEFVISFQERNDGREFLLGCEIEKLKIEAEVHNSLAESGIYFITFYVLYLFSPITLQGVIFSLVMCARINSRLPEFLVNSWVQFLDCNPFRCFFSSRNTIGKMFGKCSILSNRIRNTKNHFFILQLRK